MTKHHDVSRPRRAGSRSAVQRRVRMGATIVTAALAMSVAAACSNSGGGSGDGASSGQTVNLTYWIWNQPQAAAMQQAIDKFESENKDIKVTMSVTATPEYWTKLQTAASSDNAPDVFWMNPSNTPTYAKNGILLALSDRIKSSNYDMSQLEPSIVAGFQYQDEQWALPRDTSSTALCYNKTMFKDAGLALPNDNWTWDDMVTAAKALTNGKGQYGIGAPIADETGYYQTILQEGGSIITADGKSGYGTPESNQGVQIWADLVSKDKVSPSIQSMTDTDPFDMLTSGKLAMLYCGSWSVSALRNDPYALDNLDIAMMPMLKQRGGVGNGLANAISAKTKNPDAAWKFASYLSSPEAQTIQASGGAAIPANKAAQKTWVDANAHFHAQPFIDQLAYTIGYPIDATWSDAVVNEFLPPVWQGQKTMEEVGPQIATFVNSELAKPVQ